MANQENNTNREEEGPATQNEGQTDELESTESSGLVDEYGEPLEDEEHQHASKRPLYKRPAFVIGAVILLVIAVFAGTAYWLYARAHESTDDAFIDGHIVQVSPKVSGYVTRIYVNDNQQVTAGDLIAELDSRDFEAKVAAAKAALNAGLAQQKQAQSQVSLTRASTRANVQQASAGVQQARSGVSGARAGATAERNRTNQAGAAIRTAEANMQQARAQETAAIAESVRANADVERYKQLFEKDEVSRQRFDEAVAASRTANAQVNAARERVMAGDAQIREAREAELAQAANTQRAQTQITGARAQVDEALGRLAQANTMPQQIAVSEAQVSSAQAHIDELQAAVDQAELELSYTKIYAPESGRVTRKAIEVGTLVQVGQPLMAVVPGEVWVTANFKESQVGKMQPGQPVDIEVDAYPDKTFKGHIDSIQAGTGARFSLIPPENATGSYIKVVQRVPVKIVFEANQVDQQHLLAPGMSAVPTVKVK
jgi:membrane fusion protein (multidrug efflux system)